MTESQERLIFLISQVERVLIEARTNQELLKTLILKLEKSSPCDPPLTEQEVEEHCQLAKKLCETTTKAETNRDLSEFFPDLDDPRPDNQKN